jgi:chromosome segregation ATPase
MFAFIFHHISSNEFVCRTVDGDISFAAANQISQRVEQREIELRELAGQLSQLQIARDALLQEVSFMSARNAELEERLAALASTEMTLQRLETENGVLLALLGEKDEEVQALEADMQDVKGLYRDQLDRLYSRIEELSKNAAQDF